MKYIHVSQVVINHSFSVQYSILYHDIICIFFRVANIWFVSNHCLLDDYCNHWLYYYHENSYACPLVKSFLSCSTDHTFFLGELRDQRIDISGLLETAKKWFQSEFTSLFRVCENYNFSTSF